MKLFDSTMGQLEHALDLRLEKQNLLAGNLANADTPGYVARDLDFAAAMQHAQSAPAEAAPGDLPLESGSAAAPQTISTRGSTGLDGNGVDVDRTMVALAENGLQYGAAAKAAGKKLAILRYVASDGAA